MLSLALLLVASAGLVVGSSGFTNASADRSVSVQVVDDDRAFVGYQAHDRTVENGETVALVTVENRFDHPVQVTDVEIEDGAITISNPMKPGPIHSGESRDIRGTVECTSGDSTDIELTVTVAGEAVTAQLSGDTETREFTLTCAAATSTSTQSGG
jgi:plastocyanin